MKKFLAIVCAFAMLFTFAGNVFAADLDYMDKTYTSYDATVQFSFELNQPLQIIGTLYEELLDGEEAEFDIQRLVESMMKAEYTLNVKSEVSSDKLNNKTAMELTANVPIELSDDLSIAVGTKLKMWIEMDLTSSENAKLILIIKNPLNGKYYTVDYLKLMEYAGGEEAVDSYIDTLKKTLQDDSKLLEFNKIIKNVISGNAKITSLGNTRKIEISGDAMSKYITDFIDGVVNSEYMSEMFKALQLEEDEDFKAETQSTLDEVKDVLGKLKIFADDAVVTNVTLDKSGYVNTAEEKVHIAFNLAELLKGFDVEEDEMYPITKENSNVDFAVVTKVTYTNVNDTKVELPALTEDNSIDWLDKLYSYGYDDSGYDSEYWNEYWYRTTENFYDNLSAGYAKAIDLEKSEFYISTDKFFSEAVMWDEDSISYTSVLDEEGNVTITISAKDFEKTITAKIGEKAYSVGGVSYEAKHPFVLDCYEIYNWETDEYEQSEEKVVFVSDDVLKNVLDCKIVSYTVFLNEGEENRYTLDFERKNTGYDPNYAAG